MVICSSYKVKIHRSIGEEDIFNSDHSTTVIIANCNLNKAARLLDAVDK